MEVNEGGTQLMTDSSHTAQKLQGSHCKKVFLVCKSQKQLVVRKHTANKRTAVF